MVFEFYSLHVLERSGRPAGPECGFVYVASLGEPGNVSAYAIDATTGALTPVSGSPFPAGVNSRSVAVDPTGHFAYVVNGSSALDFSGSISAYTIDPETGALTQVPGSPVPVGGQPGSVAADPTGQFVYVVGGGLGGDIPGSISAYTIDPETGALTQVPGSPFPVGGQPSSVAADPTGNSFTWQAVLVLGQEVESPDTRLTRSQERWSPFLALLSLRNIFPSQLPLTLWEILST